jgi:hypothetical protein
LNPTVEVCIGTDVQFTLKIVQIKSGHSKSVETKVKVSWSSECVGTPHMSLHTFLLVKVPWSETSEGDPGTALYECLLDQFNHEQSGHNLTKQRPDYRIAGGTPGREIDGGTLLGDLLDCTVEVFIDTEVQCTLKIGS